MDVSHFAMEKKGGQGLSLTLMLWLRDELADHGLNDADIAV